MVHEQRTVLVLGAGFTKAFFPDAPLLVDDFGAPELLERYKGFHRAAQVLELEMARHGGVKINLEQLLTRLDSKLPYDFRFGSARDLDLLRDDLLRILVQKIRAADQVPDTADLVALASFCVQRGVNVITFNYDDFFDRALFTVNRSAEQQWNPETGYGFVCRDATRWLYNYEAYWNASTMSMLKLHGSLNWYAKLGASLPYMLDAVTHIEDWFEPELELLIPEDVTPSSIRDHLEPDPVIIAPILDKTALRDQPLMRKIWTAAATILNKAQRVIFVGYSMPVTDLAARSLFAEQIQRRDAAVEVVTLGDNPALGDTYETLLNRAVTIHVDGARAWAARFVQGG